MTKPPHWLDGVAKVLRADTDDLRELARIGGVDPRTAYVGTRLDDTDLRGQDLRGMVFTDLDLSRVKHDAKTRIDPDQVAGEAEGPPILVLSSRLDLVDAERRLGELSHRLFGPDKIGTFLENVRAGHPAIILAFESEIALAADTLSAFSAGFQLSAVIVQGRDPMRMFKRWSSLALGGQVFFTQEYGQARVGRASDIAVETRFLCRLLLGNWDQLATPTFSSTLFMRAQGVGPRPILDAAAQLFDRLWRANLQRCHLQLLGPRADLTGAEDDALDHLLALDLKPAKSPASTVSMFVDLDERLRPALATIRESYSHHTLGALYCLTENAPRQRRIFIGASGGKLAGFDAPSPLKERILTVIDQEYLQEFEFSTVDAVWISEQSDVSRVVDRLISTRELWISARDLLGVGDNEVVTIWSLLAAQMRRFGSQPLGEPRQAYLQLIIRAATHRNGHGDEWLASLLDQEPLIRVEDLRFGLGQAAFKATLNFGGGQSYLRLGIEIEPEGPFLTMLSAVGIEPYRPALP